MVRRAAVLPRHADWRHKYVWYPEGPAEQLFDLESDPDERHDLTGSAGAGDAHLLADGHLPAVPPLNDTVAEQRANGWPGYHTKAFHLDVRL